MTAIETKVYEDPWSEQLLRESLTAPLTHTRGIVIDGRCIAYAIYQVIFTEGHLLNIAVDSDVQRQGYGSALLDFAMNDALARGAISFYLEVRPSNESAIRLYTKKGFRNLMVREKYYSNGETALVMICDLGET